MKTLLRIDASPRKQGSFSRQLADEFQLQWQKDNPDGKVLTRDLSEEQIPHLRMETIVGFYTPQEHHSKEIADALAASDELVAELLQVDELLIASPLYNFAPPSNLKAYLDQVVRRGKTISTDDKGQTTGLLTDKKAYIITAKGGVYKDTPFAAYDHQDSYLKMILEYMGIQVANVFTIEGTANESIVQLKQAEVLQEIQNIFS